jgi:hypothetical protein
VKSWSGSKEGPPIIPGVLSRAFFPGFLHIASCPGWEGQRGSAGFSRSGSTWSRTLGQEGCQLACLGRGQGSGFSKPLVHWGGDGLGSRTAT